MLCAEVLGGGVYMFHVKHCLKECHHAVCRSFRWWSLYVPRETLLEGVSPCCVPKF